MKDEKRNVIDLCSSDCPEYMGDGCLLNSDSMVQCKRIRELYSPEDRQRFIKHLKEQGHLPLRGLG